MKKVGWLILSCVTVLALVLASCAQAPAEEATTTAPTTAAPTTVAPTTVAPTTVAPTTVAAAEEPQYGGTFKFVLTARVTGFDEHRSGTTSQTTQFTNDKMMAGKREIGLGPFGSGQTDWYLPWVPFPDFMAGSLAESFELSPGKAIFHVRQGVRWQNKAPANGREFTANDAAKSLSHSFLEPAGRLYAYYPPGIGPSKITATDKWTVEVEIPVDNTGLIFLECSGWHAVQCPDLWEKSLDLNDWKNALGTGPFILTDFVSASACTFVKNPNYWGYDQFYPENQLPYLDGIKGVEILDVSTQLAAVRTAKVDLMSPVSAENGRSLLQTNPELQYYKGYTNSGFFFAPRVDKPELPFYDIRVRQAMVLAVDQEAMCRDLYGGDAMAYWYPVHPSPTFDVLRIPMKDLPQTVQDIYTYNPDRARALLKEAGYPDGFTFTCESSSLQVDVDLLSVLASYWDDIGVHCTIHPNETGAWASMGTTRSWAEACYKSRGVCIPWEMAEYKVGDARNYAWVDDPYLTDVRTTKVLPYYVLDMPTMYKNYKEYVTAYVLEKCYSWCPPIVSQYNMWWPWVKAYYGENCVGYYNPWEWTKWIWIDQALKKSMGY